MGGRLSGHAQANQAIDDTLGILCDARRAGHLVNLPLGELQNAKGKPNRQLIEDYCYWFHNYL